MVVTLDAVASQQAARATVPEMAAYLQELFGQKLTALMVGSTQAKAVGRYARGEAHPDRAVEDRLRAVFRVVRLLEQVESPETVASWFLGMNPYLDDVSPARLIRDEPERVLEAARRYLADG